MGDPMKINDKSKPTIKNLEYKKLKKEYKNSTPIKTHINLSKQK